jgi:mono/diheme cytochrome c family protein
MHDKAARRAGHRLGLMMTPASSTVLLTCSVLVGALALATPARAQSRGELLYSTHCIACHTTQMHWRDKKQATDWNSLKAEVRLWQSAAKLAWSEDDIVAVTRHLNDTFYRFASPTAALGSRNPHERGIALAAAPRSCRAPPPRPA